ncbi:hypothetical protein DRP77_06870 [Candidatus Poribacteria bacterium]|nr:MAG: hypothetical protein DRP77_06870 [Candidatus Poribacteria bacterium]
MVIDGGGFISRLSRLLKLQEPSPKRKPGEARGRYSKEQKERDKIVQRIAERISIEMLKQMGVMEEDKGKGSKIDLLG